MPPGSLRTLVVLVLVNVLFVFVLISSIDLPALSGDYWTTELMHQQLYLADRPRLRIRAFSWTVATARVSLLSTPQRVFK